VVRAPVRDRHGDVDHLIARGARRRRVTPRIPAGARAPAGPAARGRGRRRLRGRGGRRGAAGPGGDRGGRGLRARAPRAGGRGALARSAGSRGHRRCAREGEDRDGVGPGVGRRHGRRSQHDPTARGQTKGVASLLRARPTRGDGKDSGGADRRRHRLLDRARPWPGGGSARGGAALPRGSPTSPATSRSGDGLQRDPREIQGRRAPAHGVWGRSRPHRNGVWGRSRPHRDGRACSRPPASC
jgi:hypothetical protein